MDNNLIAIIDKVASSLEEKGMVEEAKGLDVVANTLELNIKENSKSVEGSYIIISEEILDYDSMFKEAGKKKRKRVKKWIPNLQEGGLHKDLGVSEGKDIPKEMIDKKYKALKKKSEGDKKLSESDSKLFKRLQFAINARGFKKSKK